MIAATGHLLGFRPADSIVLVGHGGPESNEVCVTLRADLPPARHEHALAEQLVNTALLHDSTAVTLVVIGGRTRTNSKRPPRPRLISAVAMLLEAAEIPLLHAVWAPSVDKGVRWRCYQDAECGDTVPDPASSELAASKAAQGAVTFPSREELAKVLLPDPDDALARREKLLDEWLRELDGREPGPDQLAAEGARAKALVRDTLREMAEHEQTFELTDELVARLGLALSDHLVRDEFLATALPSGSASALVAERLWLLLTRAVPVPERAEPACLLAYSAYVRGDGAFAGMAVDAALDANPAHLLAGLLRRALDAALPPEQLTRLAEPRQHGPASAHEECGEPTQADGSG